MAVLIIEDLAEDVYTRLRERAARNGRSVEAEASAILARACDEGEALATAEELQTLVDRLYGDAKPTNVVGDLIAERRREALKELRESEGSEPSRDRS